MQVRQKRAVFPRVPSKHIQQTGDRIGPRAVHGGAGCPRRRLTVIEPEHGPYFFVYFQFTKVGRLLWPPHTPAYAADKITFMEAIPACCSNFYGQQPTEGETKIGACNCGLRSVFFDI